MRSEILRTPGPRRGASSSNANLIDFDNSSPAASSSPSKFSAISTSHLSPWRIKVSVQAERDDDEDDEAQLISLGSPTRSRRLFLGKENTPKLVTRTVIVPLKGGDDTSEMSEDTLNLDNDQVQEREDTLDFLQTLTTRSSPRKASQNKTTASTSPRKKSRAPQTPGKGSKNDNNVVKKAIETQGTTPKTRNGTPGRKRKNDESAAGVSNGILTETSTNAPGTLPRKRGRPSLVELRNRAAHEAGVVIDNSESHSRKVEKEDIFRRSTRSTRPFIPSPSTSQSSRVRGEDLVGPSRAVTTRIGQPRIVDNGDDTSIMASEGFTMIAPNSSAISFSPEGRRDALPPSPRETPDVVDQTTNVSSTRRSFSVVIPRTPAMPISDDMEEDRRVHPQLEEHRSVSNLEEMTFFSVESVEQLTRKDQTRSETDSQHDAVRYPSLPVNIKNHVSQEGSLANINSSLSAIKRAIRSSDVTQPAAIEYPKLPSASASRIDNSTTPSQLINKRPFFLQPLDDYVVPGFYNETTHFEKPAIRNSASNRVSSNGSLQRGHINKPYTGRHHVPSVEADADTDPNHGSEDMDIMLPDELLEDRLSGRSSSVSFLDSSKPNETLNDSRSRHTKDLDKSVRWNSPIQDELTMSSISANITSESNITTKPQEVEQTPPMQTFRQRQPTRLLDGINVLEPYRPDAQRLPNGKKKPLVLPQEWQSRHFAVLTEILFPGNEGYPARCKSMARLHVNETMEQAMKERKKILFSFPQDDNGDLLLSEKESEAIDEFEERMRRKLIGEITAKGELRREWGFTRGQVKEALVTIKVGRERRRRWILAAGESLYDWGL